MRAAVAFSAALVVAASARRCGPRASSATLAVTSITISSTPSSTDTPAPTETPASTSTIIVDTTTSSADLSISSPDPSTSSPDASTSSSSMSTSTTAPALPTPTVLGFCLKAVTPGVPTYGQRVVFVDPNANLQMVAFDSTGGAARTTAYFNLDSSTGAVTMNNTDYAGYQMYLMPPFNAQMNRVLRITRDPANPLLCFNADGQYKSGSILKCSGTGSWDTGSRTYTTFTCPNVSRPAGVWEITVDGYQSPNRVAYDVAMFFGNDCM